MANSISSHGQKRGRPLPLGATVLPDGVNFAIFSRHALSVELVIDHTDNENGDIQRLTISLNPEYNKTGDIWHILLPLYWKNIRYGYIMNGGSDVDSSGVVYDPEAILIDPYCRKLIPRSWGENSNYGNAPCCMVPGHRFDWSDDKPPKIPLSDTIIYELHVRSFSCSSSSHSKHPGTYSAIIEKIPYLQSLGITAVELMPVAEFDENDSVFTHPETGEKLRNLWGYNSVNFLSPKSGYGSEPTSALIEFKEMVLALHRAGIEVILDIVFNHSGEGGYDGTTSSFRGIDNPIYYLLDRETREYMNFSGCGNTLNCNHPVVRELIRSSLRYWVVEMHVDGFRFDLASILGRDQEGNVLPDPPMLELIAEDPVLRDTKIIAEAWDAAGLYQVGSFSTDTRWSEWNGRYRDDVRSFFAGFKDSVNNLATRVAGSSDLFQPSFRGPYNSINFITSHDGFTLYDLVSYNNKNNLYNGENNRDGDNHNISWNSGFEGAPASMDVEELRLRRAKSMILTLMISQGVPMVTAGDEFLRSQQGNNNAWCQDNQISWLDWSLAEKNSGFLRFFRHCIDLRKSHPVFRRNQFFSEEHSTPKDIIWQSLTPGTTDWRTDCHHLAFMLDGSRAEDNHFLIMLNGSRDLPATFTLPAPPANSGAKYWFRIVDTSLPSPDDFIDLSTKHAFGVGDQQITAPMSAVVLMTR